MTIVLEIVLEAVLHDISFLQNSVGFINISHFLW